MYSRTAIYSLKTFLISPKHTSCRNPSGFYLPSISIHSSPFLDVSRRKLERNQEVATEDDSASFRDPDKPPKLFVVQPRLLPDTLLKNRLSEALNLANSLGDARDGYGSTQFEENELPHHVVVQNPVAKNARTETFFGKGTVDNIQCHLNALQSKDDKFDAIFVNAVLSAIQQRNLEKAWGTPVLDRVGLIIEIFHAHAQTREGKLQAELAALMYKKTRLIRTHTSAGRSTFGEDGESEVVSARGKGSGGRGFISGAGETELELQKRRIFERRNRLVSQIEDVRRTRSVQRVSRKRHGGSRGQELATVAVVGYTNAGKTTLVSALSKNDLYIDDRLFATVDPRLRSVILPSGRKILLSDTVGFISDLPVQLIDAFHATLEEVVEADLIVHVLDSSASNLDEQRSAVLQVLEQMEVPEEKIRNMIEVWNKIDIQEEEMHIGKYPQDGDVLELVNNSESEDDSMVHEPSQETDNEDAMSEQSTREIINGNNTNDVSNLQTDTKGNDTDENYHFEGRELEDILSCSPTGLRTPNEKENHPFEKGPEYQTQHIPHVKTSAVMGVGLQELLGLIDEKLKTPIVVDRSRFDKKWRPPRKDNDDASMAVEM